MRIPAPPHQMHTPWSRIAVIQIIALIDYALRALRAAARLIQPLALL
jgi:hypothetical protein